MINEQQIPQVLNHPLQDVDGRKVGNVKDVFQDDATGRPE
ncbi:PRC-barrel domain-containing protein [Actinomadura bangladeshensis]